MTIMRAGKEDTSGANILCLVCLTSKINIPSMTLTQSSQIQNALLERLDWWTVTLL